jgi:hypothetical protein
MQQHFSAPRGGDNNGETRARFYPLNKLDFDQSVTFRFLPDKNPDNPMGFLKEIVNHTLSINGQEKRVPCLEQFGHTCPICEHAKSLFNAGNKDEGSKFWKKRNYEAQVLVIDDPLKLEISEENPVMLLTVGTQVLQIIKEAFTGGDLENDPDAYKGGYNFTIKKTKGGARPDGKGAFPNYTIGTRFSPRRTDLPDELIELVERNLVDLSTRMPKAPSIESVTADLQAALNGGGSYSAAPSAPAPARRLTPTPAAQAQSDDDDDGDAPAPAKPTATAANVSATTQALIDRLRSRGS